MTEEAKKETETAPPSPEDTVELSEEAAAAAAETAEQAVDETAAAEAVADDEPAADAEESADDDVDPMAAELAETKDKLLRALAEMENLRRRTAKEREDMAKYAATKFARDMLSVADNLRRAIDAIPDETRKSDETVKGIVEGIELTERELAAAFDRTGITKIDPMGEKFSHDFHEAMFEVPTGDSPPGTVVQVMEVGYVLHDRLLRPARVGVAKALPEAPAEEGIDTTA